MGVPRLFSYLRNNYGSAFSRTRPILDEVYLDANALLYAIVEETKAPERIAQRLLEVAREYSVSFSCPCSIYIDGAAHMGKLKQQRSRRFLYDVPTIISTTTAEVGSRRDIVEITRDDATGNLYEWSPAMFSPGTIMMQRIHAYIIEHLNEYGITTYSSYLEPGEGEHKILDAIRSSATISPGKRVGIVGKDADLLLLGMSITLPEGYNLQPYVLRHDDSSVPNGYKPDDPLYYIDCTLLRNLLVSATRVESVWDLILSSFLAGNDFLPPVPELDNIYTLFPLLTTIFSSQDAPLLLNNGEIDWREYAELIDRLSTRAKLNNTWIQTSDDKAIPPDVYDSLYYPNMTPFDVDKDKLVMAWMTTIEWTYRYYRDGPTRTSVAWQYPVHFSPTLHTLRQSPMLNDECSQGVMRDIVTTLQPVLTPEQALTAMLPIWLHTLLPPGMAEKARRYPAYYPYAFSLQSPTLEPIIPVIPYEVASSL